MPPRLSVLTLAAEDLPRLRRFYGLLGWEEIDGSDDEWAAYLLGGVLLALFPAGLWRPSPVPPLVRRWAGPA